MGNTLIILRFACIVRPYNKGRVVKAGFQGRGGNKETRRITKGMPSPRSKGVIVCTCTLQNKVKCGSCIDKAGLRDNYILYFLIQTGSHLKSREVRKERLKITTRLVRYARIGTNIEGERERAREKCLILKVPLRRLILKSQPL